MVCSRLACDDCTFGLAQPSRISFFWQTKLGTHNQLFESCKMVSLSFNSEVLRYLYVYGYTGIRVYIRGYTYIYGYTGIPYTVLANPTHTALTTLYLHTHDTLLTHSPYSAHAHQPGAAHTALRSGWPQFEQWAAGTPRARCHR